MCEAECCKKTSTHTHKGPGKSRILVWGLLVLVRRWQSKLVVQHGRVIQIQKESAARREKEKGHRDFLSSFSNEGSIEGSSRSQLAFSTNTPWTGSLGIPRYCDLFMKHTHRGAKGTKDILPLIIIRAKLPGRSLSRGGRRGTRDEAQPDREGDQQDSCDLCLLQKSTSLCRIWVTCICWGDSSLPPLIPMSVQLLSFKKKKPTISKGVIFFFLVAILVFFWWMWCCKNRYACLYCYLKAMRHPAACSNRGTTA